MSVSVQAAFPRQAGATITPGQIVTVSGGEVMPLLGATNQATTATGTVPFGVARNSAVDSPGMAGETTYTAFGEVSVIAGTGGIAAGDEFVAEYETGHALAFVDATYTDGTYVWIVGRALTAAAAGRVFNAIVNPRRLTVATAPA